jgi:nicotinate-nucleotide pyrophosphorylase
VLSGTAWFDECFRQIDREVEIHWNAQDSDRLELDQVVCKRPVTAGRAALEVSNRITPETVWAIAETGVDRIPIGSLAKDIRAVDL